LRSVLSLKQKCEENEVFIENALKLILDQAVSRYTLSDDLMMVVLEYTRTTDRKEMLISQCKSQIVLLRHQLAGRSAHNQEYIMLNKVNKLVKIVFKSLLSLYDAPGAISFFKANYLASERESASYELLQQLLLHGQKELFMEEYRKALEAGIEPHQKLINAYRSLQKTARPSEPEQ